MEEPSQFSVGQTAQSLTCSIMENPHTGLDDYLNVLMACFRATMFATDPTYKEGRLRTMPTVQQMTLQTHQVQDSDD